MHSTISANNGQWDLPTTLGNIAQQLPDERRQTSPEGRTDIGEIIRQEPQQPWIQPVRHQQLVADAGGVHVLLRWRLSGAQVGRE